MCWYVVVPFLVCQMCAFLKDIVVDAGDAWLKGKFSAVCCHPHVLAIEPHLFLYFQRARIFPRDVYCTLVFNPVCLRTFTQADGRGCKLDEQNSGAHVVQCGWTG